MVSDENELICKPQRSQATRQCNLRRFIDNTIVKAATHKQGTGAFLRQCPVEMEVGRLLVNRQRCCCDYWWFQQSSFKLLDCSWFTFGVNSKIKYARMHLMAVSGINSNKYTFAYLILISKPQNIKIAVIPQLQ